MGSSHKAHCPCGYEKNVYVGGNRANYLTDSPFPFYCNECGLISQNICVEDFVCKYCGNKDIKAYGTVGVSLPCVQFPTLQWGNYKACKKGNLCPQCKQMTLEFDGADMFYD